MRARLGEAAAAALSSGKTPLTMLHTLLVTILRTALEHPGMPRLLFSNTSDTTSAELRAATTGLLSTQRALLTQVAAQARDGGELPAGLDEEIAGELLLALVVGTLLQRALLPSARSVEQTAARILSLWREGLRADPPRRADAPARTAPGEDIVRLDVRPILAGGRDPLSDILAALERCAADGVLKLIAPFRPVPLIALLEQRGLSVTATPGERGVWHVEVMGPQAPPPLELRELPAPEPLEHALEAAAALPVGGVMLARTPRLPRLLLGQLEARGLRFSVHEEPDGSALILIRRPEVG